MKFHWILEKSNPTVNDNDEHPSVRSSCTFEKGIHFFVLRKPKLSAYSFTHICEEDKIFNDSADNCFPHAVGFRDSPPDDDNDNFKNFNFTVNLGILFDMEHKRCVFYDYDKKIKRKILFMKNNKVERGYEPPIDFEKAKLSAWLKRDACNIERIGITILNEGCIPLSDWLNI